MDVRPALVVLVGGMLVATAIFGALVAGTSVVLWVVWLAFIAIALVIGIRELRKMPPP